MFKSGDIIKHKSGNIYLIVDESKSNFYVVKANKKSITDYKSSNWVNLVDCREVKKRTVYKKYKLDETSLVLYGEKM